MQGVGFNSCLISGGEVLTGLIHEKNLYVLKTINKKNSNTIMKIINHFKLQLTILSYVIKASINCSLFIIFLGESMVLSMFLLKIMRKNPILILGISPTKRHLINADFLSKFWHFFIKTNIKLANRIIVFSQSLLQMSALSLYSHKTIVAPISFVNFKVFNIKCKLNERFSTIGYIGRLCAVKGIINFIEAIPQIHNKNDETRFLIAGTGDLYSEVNLFVNDNKLDTIVTLIGWVSREEVPRFLNRLKLLVIPSYSEALPNVLLEAMACGTPVIASPVGAISDIIKDGENGFLLKSNNPKHIAEKVTEVLNDSDLLEKVSVNAYNYVIKNFDYKNTINKWKEIIAAIKK